MTVWVVRGGRRGEYEEFALSEGVVAISFGFRQSVTDFDDRDALRDKIPQSDADQLWRFANEIQVGDMVVLPRKWPKVVAVGEVMGDYAFRPDLTDTSQHTRNVEWRARDIPRPNFDQDLLYSMGSSLTVSQPRAIKAEARIEQVLDAYLKGEPISESEPKAYDGDYEIAGGSLVEQIEDSIVAHIRQKFTGNKLEHLVASILEASGYRALETRPGPDFGIDIVAGKGDMGFAEPRLCVQVKSGSTPVDRPVYQQLQGGIESFGADHGLLVSLSGFKDTVLRENERSFFKIRLWGPYDLAHRLLDAYDDLPQDIRADIPLQDRKVLIEAEA